MNEYVTYTPMQEKRCVLDVEEVAVGSSLEFDDEMNVLLAIVEADVPGFALFVGLTEDV